MWKYRFLYSVFSLLIPLWLLAQDLQIDLYTEGSGMNKQLYSVLKNTTNKTIRIRNYDGGTFGSCLQMRFMDRYRNVVNHGIYVFTPPTESKKWVDIAPNQNSVFKYPVGAIRASYKRASEIYCVELFCILDYKVLNTNVSNIIDKTIVFLLN